MKKLYRVEIVVYVAADDKDDACEIAARECSGDENATATSAELEQCADDGWLDLMPIGADETCQDFFEASNKVAS